MVSYDKWEEMLFSPRNQGQKCFQETQLTSWQRQGNKEKYIVFYLDTWVTKR